MKEANRLSFDQSRLQVQQASLLPILRPVHIITYRGITSSQERSVSRKLVGDVKRSNKFMLLPRHTHCHNPDLVASLLACFLRAVTVGVARSMIDPGAGVVRSLHPQKRLGVSQ